MFHKKIFLIILPLVILGGCGVKQEAPKTDFIWMYQSHVKESIGSIREIAKDIGYMESYKTAGSIRMLADVPMILSGAISTTYDAKVRWQDVEINFMNPKASYATFLASGSLVAKEIAMITSGGDAFFRYEDLKEIWLMDEAIVTVIEKYKNTWLSLKKDEMSDTLSGASEEDILAYKLSQKLSSLTLSDIERYLVKYPLWKEQKDLGMNGSLHNYEVTLAKENIIAMMWEFTREATGKDMSQEAKKDLETSLADLSVVGTLGLDSADKKRMVFDGTLVSGSGTPMRLMLDESKDSTLISFSSSGNALNISNKKTETWYVSSAIFVEGGEEMARLESTIKKDGKRVNSINMTLTAPTQGITVTLEHLSNADGTFDGKLNAGIGNITWKGKVDKNMGLSELHVTGAMMGSSLTLDLTPAADGVLRGPLLAKSGDATLVSANIGLTAKKEEFTLLVDVESPEDPKIRSRAEISITGKREPWSGTITPPKDTKNFKDFADEITALSPQEDPFREMPIDDMPSPIEIPSK